MHIVTKAIQRLIQNPDLAVHSFRVMFGTRSVEFYVQQRMKMREADRRDADLMSEAAEFPTWQEVGGQLVRGLPLDYDPTPWCSGCGARRQRDCDCGPIASND